MEVGTVPKFRYIRLQLIHIFRGKIRGTGSHDIVLLLVYCENSHFSKQLITAQCLECT
jgi:hypothetical protein